MCNVITYMKTCERRTVAVAVVIGEKVHFCCNGKYMYMLTLALIVNATVIATIAAVLV